MTGEAKYGAIVDHGVNEVLCSGPFHVTAGKQGNFSTMTFTTKRFKVNPQFNENKLETENVVVARLILPTEGLVGLRDLLNKLLPTHESDRPASGLVGSSGSLH